MANKIFKTLIVLLLMLSPGVGNLYAKDIINADSVTLVDESGNETALGGYDGYLRLVFFGYTQCPDICPLTMYNVAAALKALGPGAEGIRVLFISIDPKRDTPAVLARYTGAFHPSIIGLTGSYDNLEAMAAGFRTTFGYTVVEGDRERTLSRQEYEDLPASAAYLPFHSSQIYLLDQNGRLLDIIGYGSTPGDIADRLRMYINQEIME